MRTYEISVAASAGALTAGELGDPQLLQNDSMAFEMNPEEIEIINDSNATVTATRNYKLELIHTVSGALVYKLVVDRLTITITE